MLSLLLFIVPLIHSVSELDLFQDPLSVIEEIDIHRGERFYKITKAAWEDWNRTQVCWGPRQCSFSSHSASIWDVSAWRLKQLVAVLSLGGGCQLCVYLTLPALGTQNQYCTSTQDILGRE